jgi:hypothetical protein
MDKISSYCDVPFKNCLKEGACAAAGSRVLIIDC